MNHRELTIAAACILALIATTADAAGCREPVTPLTDPMPEPEPTYDIAPDQCCIEAVSRWDARRACQTVWRKG